MNFGLLSMLNKLKVTINYITSSDYSIKFQSKCKFQLALDFNFKIKKLKLKNYKSINLRSQPICFKWKITN